MKTGVRIAVLGIGLVLAITAVAQDTPDAENLNRLAEQGYETDPGVLKEVATGGLPMGRWKEGLTFDGVAPMPWLKSASNWFPKTEEVQPDEIRVTFMGSSPLPRPGQMGTSVYVELGSGDNFIFDMGPGSIANYLAAGVPLNRLNNIFNRDRLLSHVIADWLEANTRYCVGVNEPYSVGDDTDYAIPVHGERRGLPCVEFEIRNDLIADEAQARAWADLLVKALSAGAGALGQ